MDRKKIFIGDDCMLNLEGRTCVIAGATGNVGIGAVKQLAEAGMNVAMVTHDIERASAICDELKEYPGVVTFISNENGDDMVFDKAAEIFGSIDVVICNTGGMDNPIPVETVKPEQLNTKLSHQVTNTFMMVQAAIPYLKNSRAPRIILTTSVGSVNGYDGESIVDSISRGGVISMTYALARKLAASGITVNCIAKGGLINDHQPVAGRDLDITECVSDIPMGVLGTANEFGGLILYIASEESAFITGQIFNLSGGLQLV